MEEFSREKETKSSSSNHRVQEAPGHQVRSLGARGGGVWRELTVLSVCVSRWTSSAGLSWAQLSSAQLCSGSSGRLRLRLSQTVARVTGGQQLPGARLLLLRLLLLLWQVVRTAGRVQRGERAEWIRLRRKIRSSAEESAAPLSGRGTREKTSWKRKEKKRKTNRWGKGWHHSGRATVRKHTLTITWKNF